MKHSIGFASLCAQELHEHKTTKPHQLPIYATSSFEFEGIEEGMDIFRGTKKGHIYSRFGNPTIDTVADKLAQLESHGLNIDATGILVSSGMAAISTLLLATLRSGDKILTQGNLYGGTTELLKKVLRPIGIETLTVNLEDLDQVESSLRDDASIRLVFFETPANPTLACIDLEGICRLAHHYDCYAVADNTFCTPSIQQPLQFGADFVIHSTTKYLNGHGNGIAGVIIGKSQALMQERVFTTMKLAGTNCNPWDAWLINNGLKTLALRMERHSQNAMAVARFLSEHPQVENVNYPGLPGHPSHEIAKKQMKRFGGMLSFELKGGLEAGKSFMDRLEMCSLAPTLGDVDTLILHPASMSHVNVAPEERRKYGISDGLIRISVGIEAIEDIIADLERGIG